MGQRNNTKKVLKKRRQRTQIQLGGPQLNWTACAYVLGYPQRFKTKLTPDQAIKAGQ